jgi:hypothetical protein
MERNGITSKITGDNYRDYKKYLEIQKMNNGNNNFFLNNNANTNNNTINNRIGNRTNENQINQQNNQMNITANSTNSRVPFVYIPMNRPPSSDSTKKNCINTEDENRLYLNNNNSINNQNISENLNENKKLDGNISNNQLLTEINNLKMMLSRTMKNQTETQNKIMEYDKIISEQENIIRLNNLKLNEHDNKLTEILLSFNNYLQLNEKTSMIINDTQKKMDNFVKSSDFIDLKSTVYTLNKENENKIMELNSLCGDLDNKVTEMGKENENYQKFALERMKQIQKDSMDTRLQQQNELIKMEDARDNRINAQFSQLKNLISINDNNIKEEQEYRKTMINDLRNEILNIFGEKDDQISKLERSQLETEKNLISLNKDYIQSFNELINKNNEKYNFELKSIRSLIEAGLTKVDIKMEKDLKTYEENFILLKSNILEQKTNLANLDTYLKESINDIENKMEMTKGTNNDYFSKFDLLSTSFKQFMEESLNIINSKTKEVDDKLTKLIGDEIHKVDEKIEINSKQNEKHFNDIDEKLSEMKEQLIAIIKTGKFDELKNMQGNVNDINLQNNPNKILIREFVQKVCDENIQTLKITFNEYEQELMNNMNVKNEEAKAKFALEQKENVKKIEEIFNKKLDEVNEKINKEMKENEAIRDGKVQEYIVESELRVTQKYDGIIKNIQEDLESLTIKIGLGP